jgi:LPS sulfotransferase NodH
VTRGVVLVTGPARSGTTLVARLLSAHGRVELAVDPLFPLVRAARNALVAGVTPPLDPAAPLQDDHGTAARLAWLDAVVGGDLRRPVAPEVLAGLRRTVGPRCAIESPDLVDLAESLEGDSIAAALEGFLRAAADHRGVPDGALTGLKEVWAADLVPPLLRAFPGARAILVRRDPRAVLASNLRMAREDPAQVAHPLSVLRHWRKQEALAAWMARRPALAGRVQVLGYEELLRDPQAVLDRTCRFLGVDPDPGMLDPGRMRGADGTPWVANTTFAARGPGLDPDLAERWRGSLPPARRALAELVCGPEMAAAGYACEAPDDGRTDDPALLAQLADDHARTWSWRSDLGEPALDWGLELARRAAAADPAAVLPEPVERTLFLFPEARQALAARHPHDPPGAPR